MPTAPSTRTEVGAAGLGPPRPSGASVRVDVLGDRPRVVLRSGLVRAQQVHGRPDRPRVALIAGSALLLGGDRVELEVELGAGAALDLVEVAGTVAYPGPPAGWHVRVRLGAGASLTFDGRPFVVATGATVDRTLDVDLATEARLALRETLVLGRTGEVGGGGRTTTAVRREGTPVLLEEQRLDPGVRALPGLFGPSRVLDSVLVLGDLPPASPPPGAATLRLVDDAGWTTRWLGPELADSPLDPVWAAVRRP